MRSTGKQRFETLAREATKCRECFVGGEVEAARIDVAQPLWVGPEYWTSDFRVAVLMCNPGQGLEHQEWVDEVRGRLRRFRVGELDLGAILRDQRNAMAWSQFYVDGLQLNLDELAFVNVAWCATKGNVYPRTVLGRCFTKHTGPLLEILRPSVVLAAGVRAQAFIGDVSRLPGKPRVIPVLHHAHREGRAVAQRQLSGVRLALEAARTDSGHAG